MVALAFNWFLLDFKIASGGVSGISVITEALLGWRPALTQAVLNVLLLASGFLLLGNRFGLKSIYGTLALPLFVYWTEDWPTITTEPLLASLYGGVGVGLGLGLVFRSRASTGGLDLVAQIIHHFFKINLGRAVQIMDGLVVVTAGIVFGPEQALYALITLFVVGRTIDMVQVGLRHAKLSLIISNHEEEIRNVLLHELDRGVTRLPAYGGYTETKRSVLMCVIPRGDISKLKRLVSDVDPHAFVIISDTSDVLGEGFKRNSV